MHSKSIPPDDSSYKSEVPPADLYPLSGIAATRNGNVPCARIVRVLAQVGGPLADLHSAGRVHGNISIDSVGLDGVGHAYLMTAATDSPRSAGDSALRDGRASGYNAFEQYTDDPQWQVGPWTDVYALCAVAYRLTTGAPPPSAIDRCVRDTLGSLAERAIKGYPPAFLEAIDRGLALRPQDRFEDVHAMLVALGWDEAIQTARRPVAAAFAGSDHEHPASPPTPHPSAHLSAASPQRVADLASAPRLLPVAGTQHAPHAPERVAQAAGAGASSDRRARAWSWLGWPVGLALVAGLGYLWLGTETASPQSSARAPIGSDARASAPRFSPASGQSAVPRSDSAPSTPPDIFSQNVSNLAPTVLAQPGSQETQSLPPVVTSPPDDNLGEKAVKPVSAVRVSVDIRPWGEVFVDGTSRGVSPPLRQLNLLPGSYQVTVRNPNAPSYSKRVTVSPGQRAVAITHQFTAP